MPEYWSFRGLRNGLLEGWRFALFPEREVFETPDTVFAARSDRSRNRRRLFVRLPFPCQPTRQRLIAMSAANGRWAVIGDPTAACIGRLRVSAVNNMELRRNLALTRAPAAIGSACLL